MELVGLLNLLCDMASKALKGNDARKNRRVESAMVY
jgi:hypothetical protein